MAEEVKFYVSSYVNLLRQYYLKKHFERLNRILSRQIGWTYYLTNPFKKLLFFALKKQRKEKFMIAEINTFMIASTSFPLHKVDNAKKRKKIEKKVLKEIQRYHKQEIQFLKRKALKNKELKEYISIFLDAIKILDNNTKARCKKEIISNTDAYIHKTMDEIANIINKTWVIVWDYPGTENDVLVLDEMITKRADNGVEKVSSDLAGIIDELILTLFAYYHYEYTEKLIEELQEKILNLKQATPGDIFDIAGSGEKIKILTLLRSTYGKITSTYEYIVQLERQVNRLLKVSKEIEEELTEMGFTKKHQIFDLLIPKENFVRLLKQIDKIKQDLETLQNLYVQILQIPKDKFILKGNNENFKTWSCSLSQFIPISEVLSRWIEQFSDIADFTTTKGKLIDETEEDIEKIKKYHVYGKQLFKSYRLYSGVVHALRGVTIGIKKGEFLGIMGPSGSGKTTLLNLLAGLDRPDQGKVYLNGKELTAMGDNELSGYRKKHMGFIFQTYNLIPHLYVIENTLLPAQMANQDMKLASKKADLLLDQLGILELKKQYPAKLSGGQMQRATISRALINDPEILFCDEPTGDLDQATGEQVMSVLKELHEKYKTTIILVTHDESLKKFCDRIVHMKDGQIINEEYIEKKKD